MQPPMIGTWQVTVIAARPYTIHGDLYFEVQSVRADDASDSPITLRIPQHALASAPSAGEKLTVTFLMGQVTAAVRSP